MANDKMMCSCGRVMLSCTGGFYCSCGASHLINRENKPSGWIEKNGHWEKIDLEPTIQDLAANPDTSDEDIAAWLRKDIIVDEKGQRWACFGPRYVEPVPGRESLDIRTKVNQLARMATDLPIRADKLRQEIFNLLDVIEDNTTNQEPNQ